MTNLSQNIFYVYLYLRSSDSANGKKGTPYYVGKGKGNRWIIPHGRLPVPKNKDYIIKIAENLSESDAFTLEIRMITEHGRLDLGTGILRNHTDGGDGTSGYKLTQEQLAEHIKRANSPEDRLKKSKSQKIDD